MSRRRKKPKLTQGEKTEIEQTELANTPTYDEIQDSVKVVRELQQQVKQFEFHGYMRSGEGLNSEGGQMVAFQAPGAGAKYRLGNEADTYGELIFVNNWLNPEHDTDKAWMRTEVLVEANTTQSAEFRQHRPVPLSRGVHPGGKRSGVESVSRVLGRRALLPATEHRY